MRVPLMIASYIIGLPYGPRGVALAYSAVMTLWLIPGIAWCVRGTVISLWDIARVVSRPLASILPAAGLAFGVGRFVGQTLSPLPRLILESTILLITYSAVLLFVAGQKEFYLDLLRGLKGPSSVKEKNLVSAL